MITIIERKKVPVWEILQLTKYMIKFYNKSNIFFSPPKRLQNILIEQYEKFNNKTSCFEIFQFSDLIEV